jgi:hypothetical protein
VRCDAAGWITVGRDEEGRGWAFPFGRAVSLIENIDLGRVGWLKDVSWISVGSRHFAVAGTRDKSAVWIFAKPEGSDVYEWTSLHECSPNEQIAQLICGNVNTFYVIQKSHIQTKYIS